MTRSWTGPPLPPHWAAPRAPVMVGREAELRLFQQAWAEVGRGARQVVLVGAESGGGKSRLVMEAVAALAVEGAPVLTGSCVAELGSPYQPFTGPVESLLDAVLDGRLPAGPGIGVPADELADQLSLVAGRSRPDPTGGATREYRARVYGAVRDAVRAAARAGPLVLVLEDLHWAAPDGLQLLTYLVERTADLPVLVVVTYRNTAPDRVPAVLRTLTALYRLPGVQRVDLAPLAVEDVTDLLVHESHQPEDRVRTAARAVHRHTGGNPFFVREVWRDLAARGGLAALGSGPISAPASVRDTFEARLDQLPRTTRQLIELAAVLGDEVGTDLLIALDGATPTPAGQDAVLDALDVAVELGLLEPVTGSGSGGQYRFLHALARRSVLDLMPPSRLIRAHARAVDVLEDRPEVVRWVQRLAHHCASARTLGYGDRAVRYCVEAARQADRALAHDEAADLYEEAARLPEAAGRKHELWLRAARSHFLAADFARALDLDDLVFHDGQPRDRLAAAIGYAAASWRLGQHGAAAAERLTTALSGVEHDPTDPMFVRGLSGLGRALAFSGDLRNAADLSDRAIGLARALGRDDLLADALQAGHHVGNDPASSAVRLARAEELTALAHRTGDLGHLGPAAYQRVSIGYLRGDRRRVEDAHEDMLLAAQHTGQQFWEYVAEGWVYARHVLAGELEAADRSAEVRRDRGRGLSASDRAEGPFGIQTFMVRREAGRLEQVRPLVTGNERPQDLWAPGLLALYTELGLAGPARRVLRWLLDEGLDHYDDSADWPATLAFLTEAALQLGDEATCRLLRPRLAEYAGLNLAAGLFVAVFGSADRYLGCIDSLVRRRGAMDELDSAAVMDARMDAPLHLAHSLAAQVLHLRRVGAPPRQVHDVVTRVRQIAEPRGLRRVLRTVGAAAATGAPADRPDGLTAREVQILRLLADGMSNRDIARHLVISESTAANHVRSIFIKTGVTNRTQAARYAAVRQLLG